MPDNPPTPRFTIIVAKPFLRDFLDMGWLSVEWESATSARLLWLCDCPAPLIGSVSLATQTRSA